MHLAAESHVDRSIDGPAAFIETNVVGTFTLLEAARRYLRHAQRRRGALPSASITSPPTRCSARSARTTRRSTRPRRYDPRSPYSASKAASDHLVRAWFHTYGLPTIVSNTANNYGPWQFPEKLIPLVTLNALEGKPLPVYGDGSNRRDWIFVEDHAAALVRVLEQGEPGATYAIGARQPRSNLDVVRAICADLDRRLPDPAGPRERLIHFVTDRPGPRFPLRDRPVAQPRRHSAGPRRTISRPGWRAPSTGTWRIATGGRRCAPRRYAGQRLGTAA